MPSVSGERLPSKAWSCAAPALALLVPGLVALGTHQILLFASLGPTAMTMVQQPGEPAASVYNVLAGHIAGLVSAFGFVLLLGLSTAPSVFEVHSVSGARVSAAVLAITLASALEIALRAQHPPAAATSLLAALGSFHPNWHDTAVVIAGLVLVTASSALLRTAYDAFARRAASG